MVRMNLCVYGVSRENRTLLPASMSNLKHDSFLCVGGSEWADWRLQPDSYVHGEVIKHRFYQMDTLDKWLTSLMKGLISLSAFTCALLPWLWPGFWSTLVITADTDIRPYPGFEKCASWSAPQYTVACKHSGFWIFFISTEHSGWVGEKSRHNYRQSMRTWTLLWSGIYGYE